MPYDNMEAVAGLVAEQQNLIPLFARGRSKGLEEGFELAREQVLADPCVWLAESLTSMSAPERTWFDLPEVRGIFDDEMREAVRRSAEGYISDGLAWPQPFEVDPSEVTCPVRAVHGTADDWEPLTNLQRILATMPNTQLILLDGLSHLGPLLYPDLLITLATG